MSTFVAYPLDNGSGQVVVEIDDQANGLQRASNKPGEIAATLGQTFEAAASGLRPIAKTLLAQVQDLGPQEVTVEFGIKFGTEAGVILAKAAAEGACKVTLHWKSATATTSSDEPSQSNT